MHTHKHSIREGPGRSAALRADKVLAHRASIILMEQGIELWYRSVGPGVSPCWSRFSVNNVILTGERAHGQLSTAIFVTGSRCSEEGTSHLVSGACFWKVCWVLSSLPRAHWAHEEPFVLFSAEMPQCIQTQEMGSTSSLHLVPPKELQAFFALSWALLKRIKVNNSKVLGKAE